jgi:ribosomal protein S18 acetylase RimI-like enzyme
MKIIKASYKDKQKVIEILAKSFFKNKTIVHLFGKTRYKPERAIALLDYIFELCFKYGEVWLNEEKTTCAVVIYPDKKKYGLFHFWQDVKLVFKYIGLSNANNALNRQKVVTKVHPVDKHWLYLWFIGVMPETQGSGVGSDMLKFLISFSAETKRDIYVETAALVNLPWYYKHGFECYHHEYFGYTLYFLRRRFDFNPKNVGVDNKPNQET